MVGQRTVRPKQLKRQAEAEYEADPALRLEAQEVESARTRSRADCEQGFRPCPFVSCSHHLAVEVTKRGALVWNFPGRELEDLTASCALDVAEQGGATLEEVGRVLNLSRERVRQVEFRALKELRRGIGVEEGGAPTLSAAGRMPGMWRCRRCGTRFAPTREASRRGKLSWSRLCSRCR